MAGQLKSTNAAHLVCPNLIFKIYRMLRICSKNSDSITKSVV